MIWEAKLDKCYSQDIHYQFIENTWYQIHRLALFKLADKTLYGRPSHLYGKHCKVWRVIKQGVLHDIPYNINLGRNSIYYLVNLHIYAIYYMINCDKENDKNLMHLYTMNLQNWTHGKHTKPCKKGYCPIYFILNF